MLICVHVGDQKRLFILVLGHFGTPDLPSNSLSVIFHWIVQFTSDIIEPISYWPEIECHLLLPDLILKTHSCMIAAEAAPQSIDHFVTDSQEAGEKNAMLLLHIFSPLSRD